MRAVGLCCVGLLVVGLAACEKPIAFDARIDPPLGHVPYEATILCSAPRGEYTYALPNGQVVTTADAELAVTVDRLRWIAEVGWTNGEQVRTNTVIATGSNARPTIFRPRINGIPSRWFLSPFERTLIDASYHEATVSTDVSGVLCDDAWHLVDVQLTCSLKTLCGSPIPDSVFCPPREDGVWHALYNATLCENACIVYPLYTAELASNGAPYAPRPEEGYVYSPARVREIYDGIGFPAQEATIEIVVEDEWGRRTSATFEIPLHATVYSTLDGPVPEPDDAVFFVADRLGVVYHLRTCDLVCSISASSRTYYCAQQHAEDAGFTRCSVCLGSE
ncbi:MAG: hypothetical protein AB7V19_08040 [Candidatus Bipolaricaulia bacterium]